MVTTKMCRKCGKEKALTAFYKEPRVKDGRRAQCKTCYEKVIRAWKKRHPEKVKAFYTAFNERNPGERTRQCRRDRKKHAMHHSARAKAREAVAKGAITRRACELCEDENTVMHHHDYSKPFDVNWLCKGCHEKIHRILWIVYLADQGDRGR